MPVPVSRRWRQVPRDGRRQVQDIPRALAATPATASLRPVERLTAAEGAFLEHQEVFGFSFCSGQVQGEQSFFHKLGWAWANALGRPEMRGAKAVTGLRVRGGSWNRGAGSS